MPGGKSGSAKKRWWQWRPRISLRTLLVAILLLGSALGLWWRWDPWTLQTTLQTTHPAYAGRFSKDGSKIVTINDKTSPCVWDSNTGQKLFSLEECSKDLRDLTFMADGVIATGAYTTQLWSAEDGSKKVEIRVPLLPPEPGEPVPRSPYEGTEHDYPFLGPDGKTLWIFFDSGTFGFWDAETGENLGWYNDRKPLSHMTFSRLANDRCYFAAQTEDGTIHVYELTGRNVNPLATKGPSESEYLDLTFAPDGKKLLIVEERRNLRIWNWRSGTEVELRGRSRSRSAVFSPDSKKLAVPSERFVFRLWDTTTGELLASPASSYDGSVVFLPGGQRMLTVTYGYTYSELERGHFEETNERERSRIRLWSAATGNLVGELPPVEDLVDEETIPSGVDSNWYLFPLDTNRLCYCARPAVNWVLPPIVLDAGDGSLLAQIQTGEMSTSFNVSSDGNRLLSHNIDDRTQVWVRRRPESRYGFMALPEFWLTTVLTPALLWAIYRDARDFKWFPARTARKKVTPRIPAWKRHLLASRAAKRATAARAHKSIVDARIRSRNMARTPRRA